MSEANPKADWERVEVQYRIGAMTLREIAAEHGITEGAVRKRAKRDGWVRDLTERVRAKAQDLVRKEMVRKEVRKEGLTENAMVNAEATLQAAATGRHIEAISKAWKVVYMLMDELSHQTANKDLYEQLGVLLYSPDKNGVDKLNEVYRKAMSLPSRAGTAKQLIDAIKIAVTLEREVLNIAGPIKGVGFIPLSSLERLTNEELDFIEGVAARVT